MAGMDNKFTFNLISLASDELLYSQVMARATVFVIITNTYSASDVYMAKGFSFFFPA